MAAKKLGRGLGALVALAPAADDGTARVDEVIRASAPDASVLALSGRTIEDFFRVVPPEEIVARPRAPEPPPPAPAPMDDLPDDDAREVQHVLFDPVVEDVEVAAPAGEPPAPAVQEAVAAPVAPPPPAPSAPAPAASAPPAPPAEPAFDPDVSAFLDDVVVGLVLPDVELE